MTRYFAVVYDSDGHAVRVFSDYIATVSAQEALYYASDALSSGHTQGYYGDYRYCLKSGSSGAAVIFLNASPERQSMKTLFNVSLIVAAASPACRLCARRGVFQKGYRAVCAQYAAAKGVYHRRRARA